MPSFTVPWDNAIDSKNPLTAAKKALKDIKNSDSLMFKVRNNDTGECFSVDLLQDDEDAVTGLSENSFGID